jgi:molybdopterin-guanine dinucleotide biosynthesis protein A
MINKNNIVGLVLCGGQSTRMGTDKGLLRKGDLTWAQIAREKLLALNILALVSVNNDQVEDYEQIFSISDLVIDEEFEIGGPLLGLLSAHEKFPGKDIFILACDMVEMKVEVLENLISNYSAPATVFKNEYFAEPLCGIYSNESLEEIFLTFKNHELRSHSMMNVLNLISANTIEINKNWQQFFNNVNTPIEAKGIRN